jgi:DNA-binding response OmpR family regulator
MIYWHNNSAACIDTIPYMLPKKILILDDDADLLEIMNYLLTDAGYLTCALSKGDLISDYIYRFCPDLILMDVMLGGMDGREICTRLKADLNYKVPVILISGTHNLKQVMFHVGAPDDFVAKPFDLDHLLEKISLHLPIIQ